MPLLLKEMTDLRLYLVVVLWWVVLLSMLMMVRPWPTMMAVFASLLALPFVAMVIKKRDVSLGIYSVVAWQYLSAGLLLGLMRKQVCPSGRIASKELN